MSSNLRIDKWLWHARFFKTRSRAAKVVQAGLRVNKARIAKAHFAVRPGDVLTFEQAGDLRLIRVEALSQQRGSFPEAQRLYTDLAPPVAKDQGTHSPIFEHRDPGTGGRPSKRDRRKRAELKGSYE